MNVQTSAISAFLLLCSSSCWSYGSNGGSTRCEEPKFFLETPSNDSAVSSLSEFSLVASDTDPQRITIKVNGTTVSPSVSPMPNGDLKITVHLAKAFTTPGKVQLAADAKSKEGCSGFKAFYVEVK